MANQDNKNFVENVVNAQKQMVDTMVENTRKFANGNALVNDTVEKSSEWYKNWLDNQRTTFTKTTDKAAGAAESAKDNMGKMNEFYQDWFNMQMGWAKQMWEMNLDFAKQAANTNNRSANMDPMSTWSNWMNTWNTWTNGMNQSANWMNQMQAMNPFNMDTWKKTTDNYTGIFNQLYEMLSSSFGDWQKNMQNGTAQDAYRNMINVSEGFTKFAEMWMPMWKSIQEKTFNMDAYKQMMNPAGYKELMDKFFGFLPESSRQYMQNMANMGQNAWNQASQAGMNNYQQMRAMMGNAMPNASEAFGNMMSGYNNWYNMLNNAVAPMMKMMPPNQHTKSIMEWNDIANRMMVYNIKNAELQYMIYTQGAKVMDQVAETVANKIQKGEEMNSLLAVYQEWLNISDKVYVSLFESEEYSKLMAEVSSLQMKLRKDVEAQMEKLMVGIPVATRSEMDELYKTIYDLKKQVRQLEKTLETESEETTTEEKAARRSKKA